MHDHGTGNVFYPSESVYQSGNVVTVFHVDVIKPERLEKIARRLPVRVSQGFQVLVQTTMIFGNRHFIVVDHHDQIGTCFSRIT